MSDGLSPDRLKEGMADKTDNNATLEELQSSEQRKLLDTVSHMRKCGLDTDLPLPQIVVCGDQSAGKSSVLEALTEISFPRADNLCTRFATEITMRRAVVDALTIRIIPDSSRSVEERNKIKQYRDSISDFDDLPEIMETAKGIMGISGGEDGSEVRAFARDVLSIEIEGPTRIQLTVVDLPGLIQNKTKGVSELDVELVKELTKHYISQPRTICLAVVTATNDYANQGILTMVKAVDPNGDRSLGVITKPDRLHPGSGSEKSFIELARNEDVFFKLGWHVLKNRGYEDSSGSFLERNLAEKMFFQKSNFKTLPADSIGIETLRDRLARILFEHIKRELPRLCEDTKSALSTTERALASLGKSRTTIEQCRAYLFALGQITQQTCIAAVNGTYEGPYFMMGDDEPLKEDSRTAIRRLRALVQRKNEEYAAYMRTNGHSFHIIDEDEKHDPKHGNLLPNKTGSPITLSKEDALKWVQQIMDRSRGRELSGNFNPLVIGNLFWRQTEKWQSISQAHVESISTLCQDFFRILLEENCARDIFERLWTRHISSALVERQRKADAELSQLTTDLHEYPLNYNHYYTETIAKLNGGRDQKDIQQLCEAAMVSDYIAVPRNQTPGQSNSAANRKIIIDMDKVVNLLSSEKRASDLDMARVSCQEALVCTRAIYKVKSKQFVANVTEQVIERHIIRNLGGIFSPMVVSELTDDEIQNLTAEPASIRRQRQFYEDRLAKLQEADMILKTAMGSIGNVHLASRAAGATTSG